MTQFPLSTPFAPVRFQDVLTARHQEASLRHHHPSVIAGDDSFWATVPLSRESVLYAVAGVKAACQLRTLHGDRLTALLWLVPVWTDDEVLAVLHHPDVRADPLVASEMRVALDQRSPRLDDDVPGPSRHTAFEAIDRANRALHRVGLMPARGVTLPEHLGQLFETHEEHHTRTFEATVSTLANARAHALIERLRHYGPNDRCRRACEQALERANGEALGAGTSEVEEALGVSRAQTPGG